MSSIFRHGVENSVVAEELLPRIAPVAGDGSDREQCEGGQPVGVLRQNLRLEWPITVLRHRFLRGVGEQVAKIGLGVRRHLRIGDVRVDPGHRRLGADTDRRIDDLELAGVGCHLAQRLVLPRELHVTDLLRRETRGRATGAGVGDGHVVQQLTQVVGRLSRAAATGGHRAPSGEHAQLPVARRPRIRRHDRDVRVDQVGPVVNGFRIALADQKHDGRRVRHRVVRQPLLPIRGDQAALAQGVDVADQRQRHHVGSLGTVDDAARLPARAAVRLLDFQADSGFLAELGDESWVERGIQLTRRVVGDVE